MSWEMISAIIGLILIQGGILIAAAKSIFVTKADYEMMIREFDAKLYKKTGLTVFVPREEWKESRIDRERRRDDSQRVLCEKIAKIQESMEEISHAQNKTNETISHLLGRLDQYLKITVKPK